MCGLGPKSIHGGDFLLNQEGRRGVDAGNGLHHRPLHAQNGGDDLKMLLCPVSRRPDGPGHPEVEKTEKTAHGSSWERSVWPGSAHVDRSLSPHGLPKRNRKQLKTISNASGLVFGVKDSKNKLK